MLAHSLTRAAITWGLRRWRRAMARYLSARGSYLLALSCEDAAWAERAMQAPFWALADWGVGAQNSSGYGILREAPAGPPLPQDPLAGEFVKLARREMQQGRSRIVAAVRAIENLEERAAVRLVLLERIRALDLEDWMQQRWRGCGDNAAFRKGTLES